MISVCFLTELVEFSSKFPCYFHFNVKSTMSTLILLWTAQKSPINKSNLFCSFLLVSNEETWLALWPSVWKKPLAIYHVKCNGGFLSSFWHNHGYFPCLIYHGKVWSHAPCQFPAVKGSFTTVKASCVTAPYILGNNVCQYSGYKKKSSVTDINYICITPL